MSKLTLRAQKADIAYLSLRQDLFGISVWATACKDLTTVEILWRRLPKAKTEQMSHEAQLWQK